MFKQVALTAILAIWFASITAAQNDTPAKSEAAMGGAEAAKALGRLGELSPAALRERLKQMRPPAYLPTPSLEKRIVEAQGLPVVASQRVERLKAALQSVLDYHGRGKLPIYLSESKHPKVYLVARAVIIITTGLLYRATDEELRGVVAHELAHEYVWDEGVKAKTEKDEELMREIEFFCDAVAAFTLQEIGDDPASYARVLARLTMIRLTAGLSRAGEDDTHPSLTARTKLNRFLCQRLDQGYERNGSQE
jgi:hypothetical protein